jgi:WD40 repeat protein
MHLLPKTPCGTWGVAGVVWLAGTLALWVLLPPRPRVVITPGFHPVGFTPDGQTFLTATPNGVVMARDANDGHERSRFSVGRPLYWPPALSADGRLLAWTTSTDPPGQVIVWDIAAGRERATLPDSGGGPVFSPDSRYLATASTPDFGSVRVWDLAAEPLTSRDLWVSRADMSLGVKSISFSHDGRYLSAIDPGDAGTTAPPSEGVITWWATDTWQVASRRAIGRPYVELGNHYLDAAFAGDGRLAVHFGNPPRVFLIDPATGAEGWTLPMPTESWTLQRTLSSRRGLLAANWFQTSDTAWQRFCDRAELLGVSIPWGRERRKWLVRLIDLHTGRETGCIPGASVSLSHWSPDGQMLAVTAESGTMALWDVPPRKSLTGFLAAATALAVAIAGWARRRSRRFRVAASLISPLSHRRYDVDAATVVR